MPIRSAKTSAYRSEGSAVAVRHLPEVDEIDLGRSELGEAESALPGEAWFEEEGRTNIDPNLGCASAEHEKEDNDE
jgi:hypothetical protein